MTITIRDMMAARDNRVKLQNELAAKYNCTVVSYTLNIAGPLKRFALGDRCFYEGKYEIEKIFTRGRYNIFEYVLTDAYTGLECLWAINADAYELKRALVSIEENHSLGRLLDIDVLKADGSKISRSTLNLPERSCLVCGSSGQGCARSRTHPLDIIMERTYNIISGYFSEEYSGVL